LDISKLFKEDASGKRYLDSKTSLSLLRLVFEVKDSFMRHEHQRELVEDQMNDMENVRAELMKERERFLNITEVEKEIGMQK
jgi:hypothetical protein